MKVADLSAIVLVVAVLAYPAPALAKNSKGGGATGASGAPAKSGASTAVGNTGVGSGPAPGATLSKRAATAVVPRLRQACDPKVGIIFGGLTGFSVVVIDQTFVLFEAAPPEAQVFLDGVFLGTAAELIARAFPVIPGEHFLQIVAPGFRPFASRFSTDPTGFPMRIRAALQPEQE